MTFAAPEPTAWTHEAVAFAAPPAAMRRHELRLHPEGDGQRAEIERFIATVYRRHFDAQLDQFMPILVSRGSDGAARSAAGYRSAVEPLFLERYLPEPIERILSRATGQPVAREHIVEVGQFASQCAAEGRRLMIALARHLVDAGFRWAVITATAELRALLRHRGVSSMPLGPARRRCLGDGGQSWGSYYRHAPRVLAGDLALSLAQLERGRR